MSITLGYMSNDGLVRLLPTHFSALERFKMYWYSSLMRLSFKKRERVLVNSSCCEMGRDRERLSKSWLTRVSLDEGIKVLVVTTTNALEEEPLSTWSWMVSSDTDVLEMVSGFFKTDPFCLPRLASPKSQLDHKACWALSATLWITVHSMWSMLPEEEGTWST